MQAHHGDDQVTVQHPNHHQQRHQQNRRKAASRHVEANILPFAARVGANQGDVLDADRRENANFLQKTPDASPLLSTADILNLRPFCDIELWRNALAEFLGM